MKGTYGHAQLIGRVGKDGEIFGQGEYQTCSFTIATVSGRGQYERTNWWDVKFIGKGARLEFIRSIAVKGARLHVAGELAQRSYTNQAGATITVPEILARDVTPLDQRQESTDQRQETRRDDRPARDPQPASRPRPTQQYNELDDDVPF